MTEHEQHASHSRRVIVPRRQFLRTVGLAATTVAVTTALPRHQTTSVAAAPRARVAADLDILNFALTLEHLEAEFYRRATTEGHLSGTALTILTAIYSHEVSHVNALTAVITQLGGTPVTKRTYDFGDMSTQVNILKTAETLEGTGVGAYTGQAALITDKTAILPTAASIEQVESRHYASIRYLNGVDGAPSAFGPFLTMQQVLDMVDPIITS